MEFGMVLSTQISGVTMKVTAARLEGMLILEPRIFKDPRGFFLESYNESVMTDLGILARFVQDNHSYSAKNVLRGLHYQIRPHVQGKLVRAVTGEIFDVIVDLRRSSPTFGKWDGVTLSGENFKMLWIPPGLAHGFRVVSDSAHVFYKTTDFYHPECERTLAWNDPELRIDWQCESEPVISEKDKNGMLFRDTEKFD
jgi:dTDP-4-dehydrorhamnose 3,5-epimerase